MAGRYAAGCIGRAPQLVGPRTVERLRIERFRGRLLVPLRGIGGDDPLFDALTKLVQLPILQSGGKQLIGERSLLAKHFEREEVLERMADGGLRRMESGAGDEPFERFRDFHLHISSSFHFANRTTKPNDLLCGLFR